ncbi:MAG: molybdate ABC transporter substrate-binding protein [Planctomycetales bacterium]
MIRTRRTGAVNGFHALLLGGVVVLIVLGVMLARMGQPPSPPEPTVNGSNPDQSSSQGTTTNPAGAKGLFFYCAAGIRPAVEPVAKAYEKEFGVPIQLQFGGSNTLLNQVEVSKVGDLYLAADASYIQLGREKGVVEEGIPLALIRPVILVKQGNPKNIQSIEDLLREDVKTSLGNPDQAAVGRKTRKLLRQSGHWDKLEAHVTRTGVFHPTVPEVAVSVKLSADAGIVWDATAPQYPDLEAVRVPELDAGTANITVGVLTSSEQPTQALRFARYLGARDKGLVIFQENGFETLPGDKWAKTPEITFFCGAVNRRAVEKVVARFEQREGCRVNTIYNGCGILTAQMKVILGGDNPGQSFPDTYMACDRYYLETVKEHFQEDVDVSDTEVVIAVPKGNPLNIQSLQDLTKPNVRVTVGQPDQCTIGVLTRKVLEQENVYDEVMANVKAQKPSSALLIPSVVLKTADATLAYRTDTIAESDKVDAIRIPSAAAKAIQPFSIARSSDHKHLSRRFYQAVANARTDFEAAGFHWRLRDSASRTDDQ